MHLKSYSLCVKNRIWGQRWDRAECRKCLEVCMAQTKDGRSEEMNKDYKSNHILEIEEAGLSGEGFSMHKPAQEKIKRIIISAYFINFTAISNDILEAKARKGNMLTNDPIRLEKGNTERRRRKEMAR